MDTNWNLTPAQWEAVLLEKAPDKIAAEVKSNKVLPWVKTLLEFTCDSETTLDLGSGRGENSAVLALHGKSTTLLDWSKTNLNFSQNVFARLGLKGQFCQGDMTRVLPFRDSSFDTVFSCGVLEYFDEQTNDAIVKEAFRVARHRVIMMIPNAYSVGYRVGKWYMEKTGKWVWGGEVPAYTLKPHFSKAGSVHIQEFSVGARHALGFLNLPGGNMLKRACAKLLPAEDSRRARFKQGYLLIAVGDKIIGRA